MPGQRIQHGRVPHGFPDDLRERLEFFSEASTLPWSEQARRLGTYPDTARRCSKGGARPDTQHNKALLRLADAFGLSHLLTGQDGGKVPRSTRTTTQGSRGFVPDEDQLKPTQNGGQSR